MGSDNPNNDDDDDLTGEERARAHLEAGLPGYGQSYGSGYYSQLQRAIWGESDDALLYDPLEEARRRERRRIRRNFVTVDQFLDLYDAVCFANSNGWIMNAEITINFGYLGMIKDDEIFDAFRVWTGRLRAWLSHRDMREIYIYAWERPGKKSLHVHVLMHVPSAHHRAFAKWAPASVRSLAKPGAVGTHTQPCVNVRDTASTVRQWFWFRYILKGLNPISAMAGNWDGPVKMLPEHAGIEVKPQGEIGRRRVGASRAISIFARKAAIRDGTFAIPFLDGASTKADFWTDAYLKKSRDAQAATAIARALDDIL